MTTDTPDCTEDCMACSGEVCMMHDRNEPCECNTADRHSDEWGNVYYGAAEGMRLWAPAQETPFDAREIPQ